MRLGLSKEKTGVEGRGRDWVGRGGWNSGGNLLDRHVAGRQSCSFYLI